MIFSSAIFLLYFLPIALISYWLAPARIKNLIALFFSLLFYIWGAPGFVPFLFVSLLLDFYFAKVVVKNPTRSKAVLIASLILNIGLLGYFKYFNFFALNLGFTISEILLPLGISFFTFQKISYIVDVYQKRNKPFQKFQDFALYILFFPQLIAGPIVRFGEIRDQILNQKSRFSFDKVHHGFFRFSVGLAKKVIIADQLSVVVDHIFGISTDALTLGEAWLGALAYSFQIYFDFSAYTDMALGLALMMGFTLPENFNFPYIAKNFTEFWQRWHISLSSWMRDYLYIPLGGNRVSKIRLFANLWIVFILSGFWHGADWKFIVWGIFNGLFLVFDRLLGRKMGFLPTFLCILVGWVIFRSENLAHAMEWITRMFDFNTNLSLFKIPSYIKDRHIFLLLVAAAFCFLPLIKSVRIFSTNLVVNSKSTNANLVKTVLAVLLFILCTMESLSSDLQSFIYFRF